MNNQQQQYVQQFRPIEPQMNHNIISNQQVSQHTMYTPIPQFNTTYQQLPQQHSQYIYPVLSMPLQQQQQQQTQPVNTSIQSTQFLEEQNKLKKKNKRLKQELKQ
jgi:hypothetical protein